MYLITLYALIGIALYRQFVLHQAVEEFEDIAIVITFNSICLLGAILYFGGIPIRKFKLKTIIIIYIVFVVLGFLFTLLKYKVLVDPPLSMSDIFGKLYIIVTICGLLMLLWIISAYLGKQKIEKDLE